MAPSESFPDKPALRTAMRMRLRAVRADSGPLREAISDWLEAHPDFRTIASFAALEGEPDLLPLIDAHPDRVWLFPAVREEHLTFHIIRDPETELRVGMFGIREPSLDTPAVKWRDIDLFLCPGLAFTPLGGRLGRGRGFYDRALALARRGALKLGVCFPFQIVGNTFSESHDIAMDEVISAGTPQSSSGTDSENSGIRV